MITLQDGRTFDPISKKIVGSEPEIIEEDSPVLLPTPAPKSGTRLEDLPADPKTMNVICAIVGYVLLGIPKGDICLALGCTLPQLKKIMEGEAYDTAYTQMIEAFTKGQENSAREIIANHAMRAAQELTKIVKNSKNETNRLKAASSVLDRMNIVGDANKNMGGGLTIKLITENKMDEISISM